MLIFRQLYTKLYPEVLQNSSSVELFVTAIWELLGGGKLPGVSDDHVCWFGPTERSASGRLLTPPS